MARQYHGRRIYHLENARERAEREEQRYRRRHDRLHRMHLLHPDRSYRADVIADSDLPEADVLDDSWDDQ